MANWTQWLTAHFDVRSKAERRRSAWSAAEPQRCSTDRAGATMPIAENVFNSMTATGKRCGNFPQQVNLTKCPEMQAASGSLSNPIFYLVFPRALSLPFLSIHNMRFPTAVIHNTPLLAEWIRRGQPVQVRWQALQVALAVSRT
eukprot:357292-Chlamydomonas_euryale.AAC.3